MESKVAFVIVMILKSFFKNGFIIYFFILPLGPFASLSQTILTEVPSQTPVVAIASGVILASLSLAYIGGSCSKSKKGKMGLLVGPWIDALAFPFITVMLVIGKPGTNGM